MKVKNTLGRPQELDDGRIIGAAGAESSEREYGLPELGKNDKRRVKREWLAVVEDAEKTSVKEPDPKAVEPNSSNSKGGNK